MLLVAGKIDFYMGGNMIRRSTRSTQNVPLVVVAAHFQKDPQILMSHPGVGLDKWEDLPKATAFIGKEGAPRSTSGWFRLTVSRKTT